VKSVEEFLSTIMRSTGDPATATKLLGFIEALRQGFDLDAAARSAGLDRDTAARFMDSIRDYVEETALRGHSDRSDQAQPMRLIAITDGASRGNPGQAACAVILTDADGGELLRRSKRLGVATNNYAEYQGVIMALELAGQLGASELLLKLDSELVVKQLNKEYKVKHASLKSLFLRTQELIRGFDQVEVVRVPREQVKLADKMANDELDERD
jgi:ribonuclease HI